MSVSKIVPKNGTNPKFILTLYEAHSYKSKTSAAAVFITLIHMCSGSGCFSFIFYCIQYTSIHIRTALLP